MKREAKFITTDDDIKSMIQDLSYKERETNMYKKMINYL